MKSGLLPMSCCLSSSTSACKSLIILVVASSFTTALFLIFLALSAYLYIKWVTVPTNEQLSWNQLIHVEVFNFCMNIKLFVYAVIHWMNSYLNVLKVSPWLISAGESAANMTVFAFPPSDSFNSHVNTESLYQSHQNEISMKFLFTCKAHAPPSLHWYQNWVPEHWWLFLKWIDSC